MVPLAAVSAAEATLNWSNKAQSKTLKPAQKRVAADE
jgi:hypothetical protein